MKGRDTRGLTAKPLALPTPGQPFKGHTPGGPSGEISGREIPGGEISGGKTPGGGPAGGINAPSPAHGQRQPTPSGTEGHLPAFARALPTQEANFDGLSGPTHTFGGLSPGNLLSTQHQGQPSNPRAAFLQGLRKMRLAARLGIPQGVLPPAPRPNPYLAARLGLVPPGFPGGGAAWPAWAAQEEGLLWRLYSGATMWAANSATCVASADSLDGRLHLVAANLHTMLHRADEWRFVWPLLARLFANPAHFTVHPPLPGHPHYADEGSANQMRLEAAGRSMNLLVWGRPAEPTRRQGPFAARQSLAASRWLAGLMDPARVVLARQHPAAVAAGVFHNDVIAMSHRNLLVAHQKSWLHQPRLLAHLRRALPGVRLRVVSQRELPLEQAVGCYFFNSQLLALPQGGLAALAPLQSQQNPLAHALFNRLLDEGLLAQVEYLDLAESMGNGGGPACLRLRVWLTEAERMAVGGKIWLDEPLFEALEAWGKRHYRDRLAEADLADPELPREVARALSELEPLLGLEGLYGGLLQGQGKEEIG